MENVIGILAMLLIVERLALPVWIACDAERRDPDESGKWLLMTIFFGWIAVAIWLLTRPPRIVKPRRYDAWYSRSL